MNRLLCSLGASLSAAILLCSAAQAQCPWDDPATYPGDGSPFHVVIADINNDGIQDVVRTNNGARTVSVYYGNGVGSFTGPNNRPVRPGNGPLTVADFNRDGHLDIVTNSTIGDVVSVVYGLGNNAFQDAVFYATGDAPFGVTHGDFHGDGILDLAVTSLGEDGITILRGIATGGFIAVLSYSTGMDPYDIKVGDFNEDGISDLVVTNSQSHDISILLGRGAGGVGNGTFDPEVRIAAGMFPYSVAIADFDGDGISDLAVANGGSGSVTLFKGGGSGGVGDGTFQEANVIGGLGQPRSVAAGDLNGDTIPDLAVADYFGSMHILIGNGNGTFQGPTVVPAGQNPTDVALGDFNLDGTLDAVVANYMTDYMTVFMSFCPTGPPPEVHSLSPAAGLPGAQVTIAGSNFVNVASVRFNGLEAAYTVLSDSEIRATVPPLALSGPVRVHTANGTDLGPVFTVAPRITGFAPSQAPAGTIVSINGVNFIGTTAVEFNGTPASFEVSSELLLNAVVPSGATSGPISVTNPGGTALSTQSFTVGISVSGGINLSWDDCGPAGTSNKNFACDVSTGAPFTAVGSFMPATLLPEFLGASIDIRIEAEGSELPDWWKHGTGECRGTTGLATNFDFTTGPFTCADFNVGQAAGGFAYDVGFGGPNRARLRIQYAVPFENRSEVLTGVEYYAFKVNFLRSKTTGTGACSGCGAALCIRLVEIQLFQPPDQLNDPRYFDPINNSVVSWQSPTVNCALATPVLVSVVTAEATSDGVRLVWQTEDVEHATVQRREAEGPWRQIASLYPDGQQRVTYEDTDVTPGATYEYRLGIPAPTGEFYVGETRVTVPLAAPAALSLARVAWNGSAGALTVSLSLPRAGSASFEVFDINGRRVGEQRLEGLGAGEHELSVRPSRTLDPGVFFARVTQDGKGASRRFIVVK